MLRIAASFAVLLAILATPVKPAWADIGQIKNVKGDVKIIRADQALSAKAGDTLEQFDTVTTGADASVGMTFIDGTRFSAGPNSAIELSRFKFNPTTHDGAFETRFKRGTLAIISGRIAKRSPNAMTVRTPVSLLGVRGTRLLIKVGLGK